MLKYFYLISALALAVVPLSAKEAPKLQEKGGGKIWWCGKETTPARRKCPKCPRCFAEKQNPTK